ncbi:MAG: GWxTD domain-containing protein [Acidobacteriia bacterium]|nr:GWxTD domain-containing protein [Terriglobia bacterium]
MPFQFVISVPVFVLLLFPAAIQQKAPKPEKIKDWLQTEVQYLITEEERQVYQHLTTEEEREHFIEEFWKRRDASTERRGEFQAEFYRRAAYANENFQAGIPGWRTDRGRIYILYGPPNRRDAHPMGGRYEKPPSMGGDTITTYPFEIWEYDYIDGIGQEVTIEFVDRTGTGLYVLETDPNKKDVFYWRRGEQPLQRVAPRAQEMPFERLNVYAKLQSPPALKFPKLREEIRAKVTYNALPFDSSTAFVRMSPDLCAVPVTVVVSNDRLTYVGIGGYFEAEIQLYAAVTNINGETIYQLDDSFKSQTGNTPLPELLKQRTYHQVIIPLTAGRYKLSLLLKDVNSGKMGSQVSSFWIPQSSEGGLNTSSLICADVIQPAPQSSRGQEFVLGPLKVIPNLKATYPRRYNLGLYLEVYDLDLDAVTGKPSVEVSYLLESPDGTRIPIGPESESHFPDGHTMAISKGIALADLRPGKYRVAVRITDLISRRTCTLESQIEIL